MLGHGPRLPAFAGTRFAGVTFCHLHGAQGLPTRAKVLRVGERYFAPTHFELQTSYGVLFPQKSGSAATKSAARWLRRGLNRMKCVVTLM